MQSSKRRYLIKKGFLKPKDNAPLSRSEGGKRYQYDHNIANKYSGWSRKQRDQGITPTFKAFLNELQPGDKEQISITEIFKDNETS